MTSLHTWVRTIWFCVAMGLLAGPCAWAQSVNVDFNALRLGVETPTQSGPGLVGTVGDTWNGFFATGGAALPLLSASGAATTVTLTYAANAAFGASCGTDSTFCTTAVESLMRDYLVSNQGVPGTITLNGLTPNAPYNLVLYSAPNVNRRRITKFTVNGIDKSVAFNGTASTFIDGVTYVRYAAFADNTGALAITFISAGFVPGGLNTTEEGNVNGLQLEPAAPAISLTKEVSSSSIGPWASTATVVAGSGVFYRFTITNTGNVGMNTLGVTDSTVSPAGCLWPATLAPSTSASCVVGPVTALIGTHTNTASASAVFNGQTYTAGPATAQYFGASPALTLDKAVSTLSVGLFASSQTVLTGVNIYYRFQVTNTGNIALTGLGVTDPNVNTAACVWPASLAPGSTSTCVVGPITALAGTNNNTATANAQLGATPVTSAPSSASYFGASPSLSLTKGVGSSVVGPFAATQTVLVGSDVFYQFSITNTGNVAITTLAINDPDINVAGCLWPVSLAVGATASCTVGPVAALAGTHTNTAGASAQYNAQTFTSAPASATYDGARPELSLTASVSPTSFAHAGNVLTYTFIATNTGNVTLTNVSISNPDIAALACTPAQPTTLAANAQLTCTGTRAVTIADVVAGFFATAATVNGTWLSPDGQNVAVTATADVTALGVAPGISSTRLTLASCSQDLQQDWTPRYTKLQFDVWNEDEVKFTGAFECADSWHETDFGATVDAAPQNFTVDVLQTYAARYRVQAVTSAQCPGAVATGLVGVQSSTTSPGIQGVGTTLAGAGKSTGEIRWDPAGVVPEGGIR